MPANPKPAKGSHKKPKNSYRYACVKQREKVRAEVLLRCKGRCEMTGREGVLELHECHPRSLTRNMAPDLRFNSKWCLLLTHDSHQLITDGTVRVFFRDIVRGANGPVSYRMTATGTVELLAAQIQASALGGPVCTAREVWEEYRRTRGLTP